MKMLNFPLLRQTYEYDCGAKALHSVLIYYNIDVSEQEVIKITKTNKNGTPVEGIIKAAKHFGLKASEEILDIGRLKNYTKKKIPVIILLQAWLSSEVKNWRNHWTDGHYVVAIGYDRKKIYFADPYSIRLTYLTYDELNERWHDIDSSSKKKYYNLGLPIISPGQKYHNPKEIIHLA
ncbi:MAG: hypothetical protein A3B89_00260 [Candidatus Buchananbacteria bacterium RIFCSPHIGHO2_02_FULL_40_13]|uniref:Peptidase C39 domain-containing protein n=1 Tax=Candidatus Buchananbacteria bacterium RIFCSPLOWO2_01_FULL_39_33 TaxID=1797543 RepID=A0A1G1YH49_9BACT|nr:MAG: hypothetical protein A2820_02900 [Candidatus Buchananbacteria bacterium RIFCSPHIGHO2_01_FULL_40_35]OGY49510.1 MAG: hypothetical protein A3B89_00260 [Candidatus Buchananbacteria bacterium RIFCSPHIGHO2_02_FULL_40_13]OGY51662.1 MAG: hypothetical protein A3A02_00600 [Candidatus Buchananbacteria bacterium RIFCSPLOWO2_01_FULL_39_33]